ncbi:hypothetical protein I5U42_03525 [Stenotrophomonas maltophilia]|nr:hypothetical protein [Stenotrophomonas maltophilia]
MTALVGIYCKDGIVIGADSAATSATAGGQRTIEQPVMKIDIVDDRIIIAGTGQIGMGQRFCNQVRALWANKKIPCHDEFAFSKALTVAAVSDFAETKCNTGQYGALVAFPCKTGRHLVEYAVADFQPELKNKNLWYVSMGSGQSIIDPFLGLFREVFWGDDPPTVQDAIFATTWMLDHAVKVNPGGVNAPIRIAVLEQVKGDWKARLLSNEELHEHEAGVIAAKDALRNFRERLVKDEGAVEIPPAPEGLQGEAVQA